jgi:hypothetical protein
MIKAVQHLEEIFTKQLQRITCHYYLLENTTNLHLQKEFSFINRNTKF